MFAGSTYEPLASPETGLIISNNKPAVGGRC
jgi:hypothetical protein